MDRVQKTFLQDEMTHIIDLYETQGIEALIEQEIRDEEDIIWADDYLYEILDTDSTVWALRDADENIIAGYHGLFGERDPGVVMLEHPELNADPLWSLEAHLDEKVTLTLGVFQRQDRANILNFARLGSFALLLIVLPLSLVTGYVVSRRVLGQIQNLNHTAAAVGKGHFSQRAQLLGNNDEFDRLAGNVNAMLDKIEALNANIEAVTIGIAHDLRTPLTNIGGRFELIRKDSNDPEQIEVHLDAAETAQAGLIRIFDALLRLGEVRSGQRRSAFSSLDLSALVTDMTETFDAVFQDVDRTLTCDIAPDIMFEGDAELLQQMMANLLENAAEHSRDAARVFVNLRQTDDRIILQVGDDGPGISPVYRDSIFDRFVRVDASRTTPGNGLGLSLVKAIAILHDADVTLAKNTTGAVFDVIFVRQS